MTTECLKWWGSVGSNGYGYQYAGVDSRFRRSAKLAHRMIWEECYGQIPEKHHIHHKCNNILCVNPDHLEMLSVSEHMIHHHSGKTHCRKGHEFTDENTYVRPSGKRECRSCRRERESPPISPRRGRDGAKFARSGGCK